MSGNGTGSPKFAMIKNLTHKLVYRPTGVSELYDLRQDPRELQNVFSNAKYQQIRIDLFEKLASWLVQTGDVPPLRNDARGTPKFPSDVSQQSCDDLLQPDPAADLLIVNGVV